MRYLILLSALVLGFSNCSKVEKLEKIGLTPSQMVINTRCVEGEQMEFSITKSLNVLDNADIKPLKTAKVLLYEDGALIETVTYNSISESYFAATVAKTDKKYKIVVSANGFGSSTSEFFVPKAPVLSNATAKFLKTIQNNSQAGSYYDSFNFESGKINFTINDNGKESNGYIVELKQKWSGSGSQYGFYSYNAWKTNSPEVTGFSSSFSSTNSISFYFSDALFNGKAFTLSLETENTWNQWYNGRDTMLGYDISVFCLNEGFYKHCLNRKQYEFGDGDIFKEPVYIYSNNSNGYGACGGVSQANLFIPFKF